MTERNSSAVPKKGLLIAASVRLALSVATLGALLFSSAGSFQYWNAWVFLIVLFVPMAFVLVYLYNKDRALLEKRMHLHEKEKEQRVYVKWSLLWFLLSFVIPGFDYRFGWSSVPVWVIVASVIMMLLGYTLFVVTMTQNSYASRVIEIQENQRVVDTGLYSVVRHPMYMAASIMFTACPLILGSFYGLIPILLLPVLLAYRITNEEKILCVGLAGYAEYTERVRFRLIPYVW